MLGWFLITPRRVHGAPRPTGLRGQGSPCTPGWDARVNVGMLRTGKGAEGGSSVPPPPRAVGQELAGTPEGLWWGRGQQQTRAGHSVWRGLTGTDRGTAVSGDLHPARPAPAGHGPAGAAGAGKSPFPFPWPPRRTPGGSRAGRADLGAIKRSWRRRLIR